MEREIIEIAPLAPYAWSYPRRCLCVHLDEAQKPSHHADEVFLTVLGLIKMIVNGDYERIDLPVVLKSGLVVPWREN